MYKPIMIFETKEDGYYLESQKVTNFIVNARRLQNNMETGQRTYGFTILVEGGQEVDIDVEAQEINRNRWLHKLPVAVWCDDIVIKEFYKKIQVSLPTLEDQFPQIDYIVPRTGFQKINGNWVFVFSNGSITAEGFYGNLYSKTPGFVFDGNCQSTDEEGAVRFLDLIRKQAETLYPILALNLMAVTRDFFADMGIDLALSLWLEGCSGSGKTTLAKVLGKFTYPELPFKGDINAWHKRSVLSATERIPVVLYTLTESHGQTVIVDDIKEERAQRQREKSWTIVDIVLRSVYSGITTERREKHTNLSESKVGTCAIFTGEYRQTAESQNARMILEDVSEFMQNEEKRQILTQLQENPEWQANLIGGFIRWLMIQDDEKKGSEHWLKYWEQKTGEIWAYENSTNGQRLKDTRNRLLFITGVFNQYLRERFYRDNVVQDFDYAAVESIQSVIQRTFENLGGLKAVALSLFSDIAKELVENKGIRCALFEDGRVGARFEWHFLEEQFCFLYDLNNKRYREEALFIPEVKRSLEESEKELKSVDKEAVLLIPLDTFEEKVQEQFENYTETGNIMKATRNKLSLQLFAQLKLIEVWSRSDGLARYFKDYPVIEKQSFCNTRTRRYEDEVVLKKRPVISLNLGHDFWKDVSSERFYKIEGIHKDLDYVGRKEARSIRKAFLSGRIEFSKKRCK